MKVEFESGKAHLQADEGGGFDPLDIPEVLRDAGFGSAAIDLVTRGTRSDYDGMLALSMPGAVGLLLLAGGDAVDELRSAELPAGAPLRVEGRLHPSHGDQPPGMTVEVWSALPEDDPPG